MATTLNSNDMDLTGSHSEIAEALESRGYEVLADSDNNDVSFVAVVDDRDFGDRIVAEIHGDSTAKVVAR